MAAWNGAPRPGATPRATAARRTHHTPRLGVTITACCGLAACGEPPGEPSFPPTPVGVVEVMPQQVTETREFSGVIDAVASVEVRPRVAGYLTGVHFEEGALVEEGDLLFSIDQREYEAALAAARADVDRARSRLEVAKIEFARNSRLIERNAVSQGALDAARGERQQAEADLALAEARLEEAALDLEFTRIRAPFAGRVGEAQVKTGNLVTPSTTLLTTLVSVNPVRVRFEPDEQTYLRLKAQLAAAAADTGDAEAPPPALLSEGMLSEGLQVEVALATDEDFPHRARLEFLDNRLNAATGTISAWARLDNPQGIFTPGLFARVRVPVRTLRDALLVDQQAVLTDQDRKYVYVVGEGSVAERRDVHLGAQIGGMRVVQRGLADGDRVVVSGMRKIFYPGAPIAPRDQGGGAAAPLTQAGRGEP